MQKLIAIFEKRSHQFRSTIKISHDTVLNFIVPSQV